MNIIKRHKEIKHKNWSFWREQICPYDPEHEVFWNELPFWYRWVTIPRLRKGWENPVD